MRVASSLVRNVCEKKVAQNDSSAFKINARHSNGYREQMKSYLESIKNWRQLCFYLKHWRLNVLVFTLSRNRKREEKNESATTDKTGNRKISDKICSAVERVEKEKKTLTPAEGQKIVFL